MKPAILVLTLLSLPLSSFAGLRADTEFTCETTSGLKILVNDAFAGKGHALVSGESRKYYALPVVTGGSVSQVAISAGMRAIAPDYVIHFDVANMELTSRKEGSVNKKYLFVPAKFETTRLWSGNDSVDATCIQPVN